MPRLAYHLIHPERHSTAAVFASPHSGNDYPWSFMRSTALDEMTIRSSEDAFVDRLYDKAPYFGAPFLKAGAPRAFVDLNRAEDELDPALVAGVREHGRPNHRIASGLGVIPRVVSHGRPIYTGKISLKEAERRIRTYWRPYHIALERQMMLSRMRFGRAILIDCHSMPHDAMNGWHGPLNSKPEIVLGDRYGSSASQEVTDAIEAAFVSEGFRVARNAPFAGAYMTQRYGRPHEGMHAVQVELDRALYMDETRIAPNPHFDACKERITRVIDQICAFARPETASTENPVLGPSRLAAE